MGGIIREKSDPDPELVRFLTQWVIEAKSGLLQLGVNVRNMIREANVLASAVGQSREQIKALADQIGPQMDSVLRCYDDVNQAVGDMSQHITLSMESLLTEAKRLQSLKDRLAQCQTDESSAQ